MRRASESELKEVAGVGDKLAAGLVAFFARLTALPAPKIGPGFGDKADVVYSLRSVDVE
jgi:hypothetical protein